MHAWVLEVRNLTYAMFVDQGRAPTAAEVARAARLSDREVEVAWHELHREHALVLNPGTTEIRMAAPFSAVRTAFHVEADDRWWYGNCAWDAVGICAALHADGRIETSCPDCGDSIALAVRGQKVDDGNEGVLFHCLVPAAHWWDDIVFS